MPKRLKVHHLDPAGGSPGDAVVVNSDGTRMTFGSITPAGSPLGWFNVKDYGAVGDYDGTTGTDDTAAINAAIAALNTAGRGVLYFPSAYYLTTADLTAITARAVILGDGSADSSGVAGGSLIHRHSTTGVVFTISQHGCTVTRIGFVNPTTITQTAGSAIRVTAGDLMKLDNVSVYGFYDCINVEDGGEWEATNLWIVGPVRYGLYIRHIDSPDGGDMSVTKSWFYAKDRNSTAGIRWETGGGLRLHDCKFNDYAGSGHFSAGLDAAIGASTAVLLVSGSSFENINGPCIKGRQVSGVGLVAITIGGNEFAYYGSTGASAVDIDGWRDVAVVGNTGFAGSTTSPMVALANVTGGFVGANASSGFASEVTLTSCTGVGTIGGGIPTTRTITAGTGLTGGGDLSADRTLAIDTTAEAERVQDLVGAMVVAGANVTAVYDDTTGTLTLTSSGGSGGSGGELAVTDGVTNPPELAYNDAGDDFVYLD